MSNATRTKPVDPAALFVVASGFVLELPGSLVPFCPPVGSAWRADHPAIAHFLANGAEMKGYLVRAESADEGTLLAARQRASTPAEPPPEPAPAPRRMVRATEPVKYLAGAVAGPQFGTIIGRSDPTDYHTGVQRPIGVMSPPLPLIKFVEVGAILPADDAIVAAFPQSFEPADPA